MHTTQSSDFFLRVDEDIATTKLKTLMLNADKIYKLYAFPIISVFIS